MELKKLYYNAYFLLSILCLIWGSTWLGIKISLIGFPPFIGVTLRFIIAGLLLLVIAAIKNRGLSIGKLIRVDVIVGGLSMYGTAYALVYWGEQYISSGLSSVIFATLPFYVGIMAHFWVKGEKLTLSGIIGILIGFLGVYLVFKDNLHVYGELGIYGMVVMAIAPAFSALGAIIVKNRLANYEAISLTGFQMICGALIILPIAFWVEDVSAINFRIDAILALLYLAIFGSAVTFVTYFHLIKKAGVIKISLVAFVTPLVAVIIGALLNHEQIGVGLIIGGTLVATGVAVTNKMYKLIWKTAKN